MKDSSVTYRKAMNDDHSFFNTNNNEQRSENIKSISSVYDDSKILREFFPHLRRKWSIYQYERIADVFESNSELEPLQRQDLPFILNVDEWLECHAQASARHTHRVDKAKQKDAKLYCNDIEDTMSAYPAHTVFGVLCKLIVWREKNAKRLSMRTRFYEQNRIAYSAYGDLISLCGLLSLATKTDIKDGVVPTQLSHLIPDLT